MSNKIEEYAMNACKEIRRTVGDQCLVEDCRTCSYCSRGGNLQGIIAQTIRAYDMSMRLEMKAGRPDTEKLWEVRGWARSRKLHIERDLNFMLRAETDEESIAKTALKAEHRCLTAVLRILGDKV